MSRTSIDPKVARAEAALDRLDAAEAEPDDPTVELDTDEIRIMHIDDGAVAEEDLMELPEHAYSDLTDAVDVFLETFNARDLEGLLETVRDDVEVPGLGYDRDNFPEAIEDLWERRPSLMLTRGSLEDRCVAVAWELGSEGSWWRIAVVHFDDPRDGALGVVEFSDDPAALEEVVTDGPDEDLEEGARWQEWEDGVAAEG